MTWYDYAMANGALGGKIIGAGGGGFLCSTPTIRRACAMPCARRGLTEVRFRFDFEGTKILNQ